MLCCLRMRAAAALPLAPRSLAGLPGACIPGVGLRRCWLLWPVPAAAGTAGSGTLAPPTPTAVSVRAAWPLARTAGAVVGGSLSPSPTFSPGAELGAAAAAVGAAEEAKCTEAPAWAGGTQRGDLLHMDFICCLHRMSVLSPERQEGLGPSSEGWEGGRGRLGGVCRGVCSPVSALGAALDSPPCCLQAGCHAEALL